MHDLFYYDNAKKGEVGYLVNNVAGMTVLPIEVKSGKDFTSHKALNKFMADKEYNIPSGITSQDSSPNRFPRDLPLNKGAVMR